MDYEAAISALTDWADAQDNVRAVVLTGSAAAGRTHPLSDRDIEVYVNDPGPLLDDDSWWDQLGEVLVVERLQAPGWYPSRLVYYAGGKLDLTVIPVEQILTVPRQRPFRVLVDKDGHLTVSSFSRPAARPPTAADLDQVLNWGYAAALMCAKAAVRDELWMAKIRDQGLKEQLLLLIEWDHRARYGQDFDTHHLGTWLREWMDQDVQEDLDACWGHFEATDTAAALKASVHLFARLATRLAAHLDLPSFDHERLRAEIASILARRHGLSLDEQR